MAFRTCACKLINGSLHTTSLEGVNGLLPTGWTCEGTLWMHGDAPYWDLRKTQVRLERLQLTPELTGPYSCLARQITQRRNTN